ncbi:MAG: LemA family protein [Bdellovibrionota bacterium]
MFSPFFIFIILLAVIFFWLLRIYNGLVKDRNLVKNSFSQIDVQLKRRYDLIPNLVETSRGYLKHEKETLENVIRARNQAITAIAPVAANPTNGEAMKTFLGAEQGLNSALSRLMVVAESYPDLKGQSVMKDMMEELTSTENKISFARQAFNDAVMTYNNQREVFPNSFIAGTFQFTAAQPYEITHLQERENVKVSFT